MGADIETPKPLSTSHIASDGREPKRSSCGYSTSLQGGLTANAALIKPTWE